SPNIRVAHGENSPSFFGPFSHVQAIEEVRRAHSPSKAGCGTFCTGARSTSMTVESRAASRWHREPGSVCGVRRRATSVWCFAQRPGARESGTDHSYDDQVRP